MRQHLSRSGLLRLQRRRMSRAQGPCQVSPEDGGMER